MTHKSGRVIIMLPHCVTKISKLFLIIHLLFMLITECGKAETTQKKVCLCFHTWTHSFDCTSVVAPKTLSFMFFCFFPPALLHFYISPGIN